MSKPRPAGLPENAMEVSFETLQEMAKTDPSLQPLVNQALAARASKATAKDEPQMSKDGKVPVLINGQEIYKWKQTLDEVTIFIEKPPGVPSKAFVCEITANHLKLGIKGNDRPYIDEALGGPAMEDESFMTIEDNTIVISLQKVQVGNVWAAALQGHAELSSAATEKMQQKILLERFQREHPGFDFSNAEFSGSAPNARTFMGGIDYNSL